MRWRTVASQAESQEFGRESRRELSLHEMDFVVPWSGLLALVGPYRVKTGNGRG